MYPQWHQQAACLGHPNADWWFPTPNQTAESEAAQAICNTCPVRVECRDWAFTHQPPYGTWGGVLQTLRPGGVSSRWTPDAPITSTQLRPEANTTDQEAI